MKALFFGLSAFFLLLGLLIYYEQNTPKTQSSAQAGAPFVPPPTSSDSRQPLNSTPIEPSAPRSAVIFYDPDYNFTPVRDYEVLKSDPTGGEYRFWLDARALKQEIPVVPAPGETWRFSFSETKVCALNVHCIGAFGQGGRPGDLVGDDRVKFNADDFPAQPAHCQSAVAYTGSGVLELGSSFTWVVPDGAAGKLVFVGFNIRQSESVSAKGGGILTLKTKLQ
jgi:hypothetical protein